jgi:protein dithiol:quinone oxidoreductase
MLTNILSFRILSALGCALCATLLAGGYYIEHVLEVDPCPLCIFQRLTFAIIGVLFLIATITKLKKLASYLLSSILTLFSVIGLGLAGRQMWLQHLPADQVPSCSAGLEKLLQMHPTLDVLKMVLKGSGDCAVIDFTIFGLSLANWSFFCFILILTLSMLLFYTAKKL